MFNTKQQKAIDTTEGQVILIACPGSGKTTTLLARINHMIETGIECDSDGYVYKGCSR